jgi:hypothetical protein
MKNLLIALSLVTLASSPIFETIGYVTHAEDEIVHLVGEPLEDDGYYNAIIHLANAPVYDLRTGFRVPSDTIKKGSDIRVAYHTHTDPFHAVVAWLNWNEPDAAVFTVVAGESLSTSPETTTFLSADGKYRLFLTPETIIIDPHHGPLSPDKIRTGMEFFIWVDFITASTPAMVYPEKIVLVR